MIRMRFELESYEIEISVSYYEEIKLHYQQNVDRIYLKQDSYTGTLISGKYSFEFLQSQYISIGKVLYATL